MDILFPPVLESQGLGFLYKSANDVSTEYYPVRFALPLGVSFESIGHIQVSIKDLNTGAPAVSALSPDKQVLYISANSAYFLNDGDGNYTVLIPYKGWINGAPAANTTYCIQVRFGSTPLWDKAGTGLQGTGFSNFAAWRIACTTAVPTTFGEWSNIMKAYCYIAADFRVVVSHPDFMPQVGVIYAPKNNDDPIEQIRIQYRYQGVNGYELQEEVFSGQFQNDGTYSFTKTLPIAPIQDIQIEVDGVTKNNVKYHSGGYSHSILSVGSTIETPNGINKMKDMVMSASELEDGAIGKEIKAPSDLTYKIDAEGNRIECRYFNVYRINLLTTKCVKIIDRQPVTRNEQVSFKDYTCEMGEEYLYVAIATDDNGVCKFFLNSLRPYGEGNPGYARLMKMDSTYLVTRAHQLRLQGNVQVSSFKRNTQDNFQTTIGSKYPFYSRASKMNYRSFSLSGVVSINFDPTSSFLRLDAIGKIKLGDVLDHSKYSVLISKSPGLESFFEQRFDAKGNPIYIFNGSDNPAVMSTEESVALTNRCASTLALNGLWWDDDNGDYSELYIQDKDIIETEELSLSRQRLAKYAQLSHQVQKRDKDGNLVYDENHKPVFKTVTTNEKDLKGALTIYDQYLHRQTGLNYSTDKTDKMVYIERKFRDKVMEWLSDGRPKLYRSETEGNMIVMLSGISFSPLDKTGRMVYSVSMTVTEIADFTSENLKNFNLIPSLIKSVYIDGQVYHYTWGQFDKAVKTNLTYQYYNIFEIPALEIGNPDKAIEIETLAGVYYASSLDKLVFSAEGLPNGLRIQETDLIQNGKVVRKAGTVYGYPQGIQETKPGFAVLKVKDTGTVPHKVAQMTVPYGWMYEPLRRDKETEEILITSAAAKPVIEVGEAILPIDLSKYHKGGVGPYAYSPTNQRLPSGISVDETTGMVTGVYSSAIEGNVAEVTVRDSLGNKLNLQIKYKPGQLPLTFIKKASWDFGYLEVDVNIPEDRDLSEGVAGGTLGENGAYRFSLGDDAPDGIAITADGKLHGRPNIAAPPGQFTVYVRDDLDAVRSITINYNTILEAFKFEARPDDGLKIQKIWIPTESKGDTPDEIILGYTLVGVDVTPYVSGGLPFTSGTPYKFTAIGLLPDWEITRAGVLKGKARVAMAAHEATLIVQDARGEKRTCVIQIGEVKGGIQYIGDSIVFSNLYVGKEITAENINRKTLFLTTDDFIPHDIKYNITLSEPPAGINLRENKDTPDGRQQWEFYGKPEQASTARIGWLRVSDNDGHSLRLQVDFSAVIERLQLKDDDVTVISGAAGASIERNLGAIGGQGPFTYDIGGAGEQYLEIKTGNTNDVSTTKVIFNLPDESKIDIEATVKITDNMNVSVTKVFNLKTAATKIKLKWLKDFRTSTVMANHAEFKEVEVIEISGGMGGYKIIQGSTIGNGTMQFEIKDKNKIVLTGTPQEVSNVRFNMAQNLVVTDVDGLDKAVLSDSIMSPLIVPTPSIGVNIPADGTLRKDGLIYLQYYTSPDIFNDFQYPTARITSQGALPGGINELREGTTAFRVKGQATSKVPEDTTIIFNLSTEGTPYDDPINLRVTVIFGAIQNAMEFFINSSVVVPGLGVDKPMEPVLVSEGLTGGGGPFVWEIENAPEGLGIKRDDTNTRIAYIYGTPTKKTGAGSITVKVTDTSSNITKHDTIDYMGVFAALKQKKLLEIPPRNAGEEITPITISDYFEGGQEPFTYADDKNLLGPRGYIVGLNEILGTASQYGFVEETGTILVKDSLKQTLNLPVKVGKITGILYYNPSATGVKAQIPTGQHNTTLSNPGNYINLLPGVSGGKETYTFKENNNNGWSKYGFDITIDNLTGKATKIVYPQQAVNAGSFDIDISDGEAVVTATIKFAEVKGPLRYEPNAAGVQNTLKAGPKNTTIPANKLPTIVPGIVGGTKPYTYKQSTSNSWTKYGFTLTLNQTTGAFSNGRYPTNAIAEQGSFDIIVTDSAGASVTIPIYFEPTA